MSDSVQSSLFRRWGRARHLTVFEFAYLLADADPDEGRKHGSYRLNYEQEKHADMVLNLLSREIGSTGWNGQWLEHEPSAILAACDLLGLAVPLKLRSEICDTAERRVRSSDPGDAGSGAPSGGEADEDEGGSMSRRRYNNMLKLIGAMAADHYGWTPGTQGSAPAEIEQLTDEFGAKVSDDTIRKILAEAAEQIDVASRFSDDPS